MNDMGAKKPCILADAFAKGWRQKIIFLGDICLIRGGGTTPLPQKKTTFLDKM